MRRRNTSFELEDIIRVFEASFANMYLGATATGPLDPEHDYELLSILVFGACLAYRPVELEVQGIFC